MSSNNIGYCGNRCTYCFLGIAKVVRVTMPMILMLISLRISNALMQFVAKLKGMMAVGNVDILEECNIGFFNLDENNAKAYSLFIKKYGTEKYTDTIISLMSKGYDYPKQFKGINDVNEILEIFEKEK